MLGGNSSDGSRAEENTQYTRFTHIHIPVIMSLTSVGEVGIALFLNAVGSHGSQ